MAYMRYFISLVAALAFNSTCLAESTNIAPANGRVFTGEKSRIGDGSAWTWVELNEKGAPVRMGVTFTEAALSGLPAEQPSTEKDWEYALALPAQAPVPPFTHVTMNWNPHGHVPPGVYDLPHFDFHFNIIGTAQREKITCEGQDMEKCAKRPDDAFIPADYILPHGTAMSRMGAHWIDPSAPEFNKRPFTVTFIYGTYDGKMAFLEPMAAMSFLETKPEFSKKIKTPAKYQTHGFYPAAYSLKYDRESKEYAVALDGLAWR